MNPGPDYSLYLVTDRELAGGRSLAAIIAAAVRGGVTIVQLREKNLATRAFIREAETLKTVLQPLGIPLLINDRVDVALAAGADGVHLGQEDMPVATARRLLGPRAIIGLSVENENQAAAPEARAADYLGVSPVFRTPTKAELTGSWGLDGLRRLRSLTSKPLIAIGGVHGGNAVEVIRARADGLAVVSALCAAPDPEAAARELRALIRKEKSRAITRRPRSPSP